MPKVSNNTKAQRKFMSNEENVQKVYRKRAIDRISKGNNVSVETLDKFNISEEEFNKIRKDNGFDPIKLYRADVESTKALVAKINREKYYEKAIEEEMKLAQDVRTQEAQLKDIHKTLQRENTNPASASISTAKVQLLKVSGKLTFNDIREYFKTQIGRSKFGITSFNKYFGANPNTGTIHTILKLMKCDPDNIIHCLKDADKTINAINNAKKIKAATKQGYYEAIYTILNGYPNIQKEYQLEKQAELFDKEWRKLKGVAETETLERQDKDTVDAFSAIKAKVLKKFGKDTQERLFIKLYEELPCRDNFGDLMIVSNKKEVEIEKGQEQYKNQDYLLWNEEDDGSCEMTIYIQTYKTYELYGVIEHKVSHSLCMEIAEDILQHPRDFLFIKNNVYNKLQPSDLTVGEEALYKDGRMSAFVGDMLLKAGVKKKTPVKNKEGGYHNVGSINLLRHSFISEYHKKNPKASPEDKAKLALQFKHSPITNIKYIREVGIDKLSEAELKARMKKDEKLD